MSLLSWLFPSPADRVERARGFLAGGRPDEARLELLGVEHADSAAVLAEAETQLARQNLDAAVGYGRAGDDHRVSIHLELAERFHHGGLEEEFREARRALREIRADRGDTAARKKADAQARMMSADPLGMSGGPSWLDRTVPDDRLAPDHDEVEAKLALIVENYPESLRATVGGLGAPFARAVLELEEGRFDGALTALMGMPDDAALVQWERGRAAHALGDPAAAAQAVRAFAECAEGHHNMGRQHSGVYLAELLTESGDLSGALRVLRDQRRKDPQLGGALFAQLLMHSGALEEAEAVTAAMIKLSPKSMTLYALLARVRMAGDHRTEAMRALEAGMEATHCPPGKCGFQPPHLDAHRLLATLYLEDGVENERGLHLAGIAASLVKSPTWDDAYLRVLAARAQGDPAAQQLGRALLDRMAQGDPRRSRAEALLAG